MIPVAASFPVFGLLQRLRLDGWLLVWVALVVAAGLAVLYSASGGAGDVLLFQFSRLLIGFSVMLVLAQTSPRFLAMAAPWIYGAVVFLLVLVLLVGEKGGGAQRWLDFGIRFQPSEFAKLAVPMMVASLLRESRQAPGPGRTMTAMLLIAAPAGLVVLQPDLGTGAVLLLFGMIPLFLAGLRRAANRSCRARAFLPLAGRIAGIGFFLQLSAERGHDHRSVAGGRIAVPAGERGRQRQCDFPCGLGYSHGHS